MMRDDEDGRSGMRDHQLFQCDRRAGMHLCERLAAGIANGRGVVHVSGILFGFRPMNSFPIDPLPPANVAFGQILDRLRLMMWNDDPRRLHRSLEFLDQRGAGPEVLRRHDRPRIQPELRKQEPVYPVGVALGIGHEQFRAHLRLNSGIGRYPRHTLSLNTRNHTVKLFFEPAVWPLWQRQQAKMSHSPSNDI
jgi:hypothetical protein